MLFKYLDYRLIGILRTKDGTPWINAVKAIVAARDAGLECMEITSNSQDWQEILVACLKEDINIGVGSVKNLKIAKEAILLGAKFLVSPGLFDEVIKESKENKISILPGVYLGSEALKAKFLDLADQKFFPASAKTHEELFKAIREPFRDEFSELEKMNCRITFFDPDRPYKLGDKYEVVNSPTEFYSLYLMKDKLEGFNIIIKLPQGKIGFEKIEEIEDVKGKVRTYAVGGINEGNIVEVLTKYRAYGVCPGGGIFNADAISSGDFERVKADVIKYVRVIKQIK